MREMDLDIYNMLTSPDGLQDWFTEFDGWVCRFNATFNLSRSHSKRLGNNQNPKCHNCSKEQKTENKHETQPIAENRIVKTQSSTENPTLQEFIVNGLLIAQKKNDKTKNKTDFLNIFKGNEDFTHYDYVLLSTMKENGRKHFYKYILRSKI